MVRTIAIGVLALVVAPVWGDEATDRAVAEALTVLADAQAKPPTSKERIAAARQAIKTLQKHRRGGLASAAWNIAADARQSDELRSVALVGLSQLPDSPTGRVRTLAADTVKSDKASKLFRARAAMVLRNPRFADAASRAALEQVLLRKDDPVVQRTCLAAYGATAELQKIRALLLRPELSGHAYFGIRIDVCTGLAALNVRERRALEILASLMRDDDAADKQLMVPQEAWLSFWVLTGRAHGVDRRFFRRQPAPLTAEPEIRDQLWRPSFLRKGVTQPKVGALLDLLCKNAKQVRAAGKRWATPHIRNTAALRAASEESRNDIDAIVAEWGEIK